MVKYAFNRLPLTRRVNPTRKSLAPSTPNPTRQDVGLMDLEEVAGSGNGCGFMVKASANQSSILRVKLSKRKDISALTSVHLMADPRTFCS